MKFPQRIKTLFSRLIIFTAIVVLLWICAPPPEEPLRVTRTLVSSANNVGVSWIRQEDIPVLIATDTEGMVYATRLFGNNSLIAFDAKSGATKWMIELPFELGGPVGIFANQIAVFVMSVSRVNAYEKTLGKFKWSTKLGEGHVSVVPQFDDDMLRVYYGDTIFEIGAETGKILASKPKGDIIWITDNIELHASSANHLFAFDKRFNQQVWNLGRSFFITEEWKPQEIEGGILIVGYQALWSNSLIGEICALNSQTGKYNWCRTKNYISNIAIDQQSQLGYIMRDDFVIEIIDLRTGNISEEIRFLPGVLPKEMLQHLQNYSIALSNDIMIVSFSDSGQTFGLQIK